MTWTKRGAFPVLVGVILLVFLPLFSAEGEIGCYTYPGANEIDFYCQDVTEEEARADCENADDCVFQNHFFPDASCSAVDNQGTPLFPACRQVQCDVDCRAHGAGKCAWLGEQQARNQGLDNPERFAGQETASCQQVCCRAGQFCSLTSNSWSCSLEGAKRGIPAASSPMETQAECTAWCGRPVEEGTVQGCVTAQGIPLPQAQVRVAQGNSPPSVDANGCFTFTASAGTYTVTASQQGYVPSTQEVQVVAGTTRLDFALTEQAGAHLDVRTTSNNQPVGDVTIRWMEGRQQRTILTDAQGEAAIDLPPGQYSFTALKAGYSSQTVPLTLDEGSRPEQIFQLSPLQPQGITGITTIDEGAGAVSQHGVEILVDGIPYRSSFPAGDFRIPLEPGEHTIAARFIGRGATFTKSAFVVTVPAGSFENVPLTLTKAVPSCPENTFPPVSALSLSNVPGEPAFIMNWQIPCADVQAFELIRHGPAGPLSFPLNGRSYRFQDNGLEWNTEYSYELVALYRNAQGEEVRSEPVLAGPLNTGNPLCANRHPANQFCIVGTREERQNIWGCTPANTIQATQACSGTQYCAPLSTGAVCKDDGICGMISQGADPFGLYYSRDSCYLFTGEGQTNSYCSYDATPTVVDACTSCLTVESCFDYKSEDSCTINNCLSASCQWIDSSQGLNVYAGFEDVLQLPTTLETGQGYCIQEDYEKDDQCSLCSPQGGLFENNYCTGEVCSGLGRCYSQQNLLKCNQCGDAPTPQKNCYSYKTELECAGDAPLTIQDDGSVITSDDSCSWGRCVWAGNACIKDGNDDGQTDCERRGFSRGERGICMADNQPPLTVVEGNRITISSSTLLFRATDNIALKTLSYCFSPQGEECSTFSTINYPVSGVIPINVSDYLRTEVQRQANGETLHLSYYSTDKYDNQEERRHAYIPADTIPPQFAVGMIAETVGVTSSLQVYVANQSEPVSCLYSLQQVDPVVADPPTVMSRPMAEDQQVSFSNLGGRIYLLSVSCEDSFGNTETKTKPVYFDIEPRISIMYPSPNGVVRAQSIAFEVQTDAPASCRLQLQDGTAVDEFIPDDARLSHNTLPVPGFVEGDYVGTHKVICRNLLDNEEFYDIFSFSVDYTAPLTHIIIEEEGRIIRPEGTEWQADVVQAGRVSFECSDDHFGCSQTRYCLHDEECRNKDNPTYQDFTAPFLIDNDTLLCYYSLDAGGNEEALSCGEIHVSGHRLQLIRPPGYYFNTQLWGVSKEPVFDLEFRTQVGTEECKFSFDPISDYDDLPELQRASRPVAQESRYLIEGFPLGLVTFSREHDVFPLYVMCLDNAGTLGPEHIVHLEYDPTAPRILEAGAEPNPVSQGTRVVLSVRTDDKTVCKFDDVTNSSTPEYELMSHSFGNERELSTTHRTEYVFRLRQNKQDFTVAVQCRNGAGEQSEVRNITFTADLTIAGRIVSTAPSGRFRDTQVTLQVETNKNAQFCEYRDTHGLKKFSGMGTTQHQAILGNLTEGTYHFPVRCAISGNLVEDSIDFVIDQTPPVITKVDDGNRTCGLGEISVFVYTNEEAIGEYYYELYEKGSRLAGSNASILRSGSATFGQPLVIGNLSLIQEQQYYVKAKVGDTAGNWGQFAESDGILAVPANDTLCTSDNEAPVIVPAINQSCTGTSTELHCDDATGCRRIEYGNSPASGSCLALNSYNGMALTFTEPTWVCYAAEDYAGNKGNGSRLIPFPDRDGDRIADSCDQCPDTTPGKIVDSNGCQTGDFSAEDKKIDTDGDGLPDSWEKLYHAEQCPFQFNSRDSDANGISDFDEDYDGDGFTSYEEYLGRTDPCLASDAPLRKDDDDDSDDEIIDSPTPPSPESNWLAWLFLIVGFLLTAGGTGYLVYYYRQKPAGKSLASLPAPLQKATDFIKETINPFRRKQLSARKSRQREEAFSAFDASIPHIGSQLKGKGTPERVQKVAHAYAEHQEEIDSGLKKEEQGIFKKLAAIAKEDAVLGEEEAEDVFHKLREIAKKRKEK